MQRIDPATGNVVSSTEKEINYSMVTAENKTDELEDDDKDSRAEKRKEKDLPNCRMKEKDFPGI